MNLSKSRRPAAHRRWFGAAPDLTLGAVLLAICLLPPLVAEPALAQDLELPEKAKEPFIGRIDIRGNQAFSDKDLKRLMMTAEPTFFVIVNRPRLDRPKLRRDLAAMQAFYRANGYLEAEVELEALELVEDSAFVDIVIGVREGEATRVALLSFRGAGPVGEEALSRGLRLKPGVPFNPTLVNADIYTMKKRYFEDGYLGVEISDSLTVEGRAVKLFYSIDPGPLIAIRDISITGNLLTKNSIIERELAIEEGETFRLSKAVESQRNLFETGLFTEAEILPENLDVQARTVDVKIRVRERKSAYFEFGFGVGNVLGSRVTGGWGDRNLFGRGKRLSLKSEYSFDLFEGGVVDFSRVEPRVKYYRYDAQFGQRRVFGTKLEMGINGFIEKDATVEAIIVRTQGLSLGGGLHVSRRTDAAFRLSDERIEREAPDIEQEKSHSRLTESSFSHDTRDFILDPRSGGYRELRVELAGGILGGDNDFYTLNTSLQKYWPKVRKGAIALRARVGYADAYGSSKSAGVPVENRYFTGGGNSVRGFKENSLGPTELASTAEPVVVGGQFLLVGNAELRFPIPYLWRYRFFGAVFADAGNVWKDLESVSLGDFRPLRNKSEVTEEDFRYSLGFGLRYNTPVGPIRLDFGVPLKKDETDKFGRFHLSLGQIF